MKKILGFFKSLGPGIITGASDDDPTAIATYSQAGAKFGYQQLWTALFTFPFMIIIQEMCARIGIVSGKGIANIVSQYYSKKILYIAVAMLLIANVVNIGADIGAMASSAQLLFKLPLLLYLIFFSASILLFQIFIGYKTYSKILKFAATALLSYVGVALFTKQDWEMIFKSTFIPSFSFSKDYLINLVAILGTNISPYLFFWQASEEVEEQVESGKEKDIDEGNPMIGKKDIHHMRIDTVFGMIFSNLIIFFIEISTASTLHVHGNTSVETPIQAAQALKPFAGDFSFVLFTIGIMASGFLAVPVLSASSAYAIAETLNKKAGLEKGFTKAPVFYGLIIAITCLGLFVNALPVKPFDLLVYSAAVNGILTPFLIVVILLIINNKAIMKQYTNSRFSNSMGIALAVIMSICAFGLLVSTIR